MILSPGQYARLVDLFLDLSKASSIGVIVSPALQKDGALGIIGVAYLLFITGLAILVTLQLQGRKEAADDILQYRSWHRY